MVERGLSDLPGFHFEAHFLPGDGLFADHSDDEEDDDDEDALIHDGLHEILQEEIHQLWAEAGIDLSEMLQHTAGYQ